MSDDKVRGGSEPDADHVLRLSGDVDLVAAPRLRAQLLEAVLGGAAEVVVDLTDVSFLDSAGIGVLATAAQRLVQEQRGLRLQGASGQVARALQVTGIDHIAGVVIA